MKEWLLFCMFLIAGIGLLIAGIMFMRKDKGDRESMKIYSTFAVIGGIITAGAIVYRFLV
ncbi:hypothetical protein K7I13_09110 [Brucepastera parasyntrophica]|uniref:hypothetical protein n=1 Tax=Brucepastera parasyntrophica TaxID=2880008 RepID=UPI00210ED257|nr:hypothetical protein [Brucepastera parasyntrophica]ULQ58712.1 hypothetical protein K7I13_09110 [Brucepastera parasyntrophica]